MLSKLKKGDVDIASDNQLAATSVRMGTYTQIHTGDYGSTSKNNSAGNTTVATYSHRYKNNVSSIRAYGAWLPANARVLSGVNISIYSLAGDPTSRTGEMRFHNQSFNGHVSGTGDLSHGNFDIRNIIYNATQNRTLATHSFLRDGKTGGYKDISKGPVYVYMRNITFTDGHAYRAYVNSYAEGANQGNASGTNGLKWETIDVYFGL